jgi:hypothetical protein
VDHLRHRAFGGPAPAPGLRPRTWRIAHTGLAIVIVAATVLHATLIEGAMETVSKAALCILVVAATIKVMAELRVWRKPVTLRGESVQSR